MKILRITESQYKRLVRGKNLLNEQLKEIIYLDDKDTYDTNEEIIKIINYINYLFNMIYGKPLHILKIEGGKVYIDTSKYTEEEIEFVKNRTKNMMLQSSYDKDKLIDDEDFAFDIGVDSDYDWENDGCFCLNADDEKIYYKCDEDLPDGCVTVNDLEIVSVNDERLTVAVSTGNYFGKKTKNYGKNGHTGHDYIAKNKKVVFMKSGKVATAAFNNDKCGGTIAIIPTGEDRKSIFCHMSEIFVTKGDTIVPGTVIGVTGGGKNQKGKGRSTGHHLHFGMKKDGDFTDPADYISDFKFLNE